MVLEPNQLDKKKVETKNSKLEIAYQFLCR
jgi:hypothetical protein